MKIKTGLKAGAQTVNLQQLAQNVLNSADQALDSLGQVLAPAAQTVANTLSDPKFWTWPF